MIEIKFTGEHYDDVLSNAFEWFEKAYAALGNKTAPATPPQTMPDAPVQLPESLPAPAAMSAAYTTQAPVAAPMTVPTAMPAEYPRQAPAIPATPAQAASMAAPAPVPTAAPTYSQEDLMVAAARVMSTAGMPAMQQLLAQFGVSAITQLAPQRYGEFALRLREMGAQI